MRLIVGLGNPGIQYQFTPHNLGFLTVDRLAEQLGVQVDNRQCRALTARSRIGQHEVLLAKPETYMNLSGLAVRALIEEYQIDPAGELLVIYDELDLPLGMVRVKSRGRSAGHNGMESIINALGTEEFPRVRLGIAPDRPVKNGAGFVLASFKRSQYKAVDELLDTAAQAVRLTITEGVSAAMNRFNRKVGSEDAQAPAGGG